MWITLGAIVLLIAINLIKYHYDKKHDEEERQKKAIPE